MAIEVERCEWFWDPFTLWCWGIVTLQFFPTSVLDPWKMVSMLQYFSICISIFIIHFKLLWTYSGSFVRPPYKRRVSSHNFRPHLTAYNDHHVTQCNVFIELQHTDRETYITPKYIGREIFTNWTFPGNQHTAEEHGTPGTCLAPSPDPPGHPPKVAILLLSNTFFAYFWTLYEHREDSYISGMKPTSKNSILLCGGSMGFPLGADPPFYFLHPGHCDEDVTAESRNQIIPKAGSHLISISCL